MAHGMLNKPIPISHDSKLPAFDHDIVKINEA